MSGTVLRASYTVSGIILRASYAVSGTGVCCGRPRHWYRHRGRCYRARTEPGYAATRSKGSLFTSFSSQVAPPLSLRARYAMSGTDLLYGATRLHAAYGSSPRSVRYQPTRFLRDVRY
eukprot:1776455-Rhodomonas_salina.1